MWELWSPFFVAGTELGKYKLLSLFFIPLYSKLKKDKILEHETRGMIRGYVIAHPGSHYNQIKKILGIKNGTLVHHLSILEKNGFIHSINDGLHKRFYPIGIKTNTAIRILNLIKENPGISQKEIIKDTKIKQPTVSYNLNLMVKESTIRIEKEKRENHYYFIFPEVEKGGFNNCPYCGKKFELKVTPNFCPYCNEPLK